VPDLDALSHGELVAFVRALTVRLAQRDALVEQLQAAMTHRDELVARLEGEVAELKRRLGQDSSNSSRPPSSDSPYRRPSPKVSGMPDPQQPKRKPGKQRGTKGRNRRQVADPDETVRVEPAGCEDCGTDLGEAQILRVYRRQVFEASPPPPPRVVQYNVAERLCPCCGKVNQGKAPAGVTGRVQWGAGVAARGVLGPPGTWSTSGGGRRSCSSRSWSGCVRCCATRACCTLTRPPPASTVG
jgi:transposase